MNKNSFSTKTTGIRTWFFSKKRGYKSFTDTEYFYPKNLPTVAEVFGEEPTINPFEDPSTVYDSDDEELIMKLLEFQTQYKMIESPFSDFISEGTSFSSTIVSKSSGKKIQENPFLQENGGFDSNCILTSMDSYSQFPTYTPGSSKHKPLEIVDPDVFCPTEDDEFYMTTVEFKKPKKSLKSKVQRTLRKVFRLKKKRF